MSTKHSRRKSKLIKVLSMILCICLTFPAIGATAADSLAEAQAEKEQLSQKRNELGGQLAELEADESRKQEYQSTLEAQIGVVLEQILALENELKELDGQIIKLESKLDAARSEMQDTFQEYQERVIAIYTSGSSQLGSLEILLNAESLNDFTMKTNLLESIDERDTMIVEKIENYLNDTEADRTQLKEVQSKVAENKKEQDREKAELNNLLDLNAEALADIRGQKSETESALDAIKADEEATEKRIATMIEEQRQREIAAQKAAEEEAARQQQESQNNAGSGGGGSSNEPTYPSDPGDSSGGSSSSGGWTWPLQGAYYVTSHFGSRWGTVHRGIDISSGGNAPVVASRSGTVIQAYYSSSYGNHAVIYHDGTYSTLYAHMSVLMVSEGDYVSAGQQIGIEGTTGDSTGRHLHFEVIQNGTKVDPWPFIG